MGQTKKISSVQKTEFYKCQQEFLSQTNLKQHILSVHEDITYQFNKCIKQYTQKQNLKKHTESVHEQVKFSCNL